MLKGQSGVIALEVLTPEATIRPPATITAACRYLGNFDLVAFLTVADFIHDDMGRIYSFLLVMSRIIFSSLNSVPGFKTFNA